MVIVVVLSLAILALLRYTDPILVIILVCSAGDSRIRKRTKRCLTT